LIFFNLFRTLEVSKKIRVEKMKNKMTLLSALLLASVQAMNGDDNRFSSNRVPNQEDVHQINTSSTGNTQEENKTNASQLIIATSIAAGSSATQGEEQKTGPVVQPLPQRLVMSSEEFAEKIIERLGKFDVRKIPLRMMDFAKPSTISNEDGINFLNSLLSDGSTLQERQNFDNYIRQNPYFSNELSVLISHGLCDVETEYNQRMRMSAFLHMAFGSLDPNDFDMPLLGVNLAYEVFPFDQSSWDDRVEGLKENFARYLSLVDDQVRLPNNGSIHKELHNKGSQIKSSLLEIKKIREMYNSFHFEDLWGVILVARQGLETGKINDVSQIFHLVKNTLKDLSAEHGLKSPDEKNGVKIQEIMEFARSYKEKDLYWIGVLIQEVDKKLQALVNPQ
jgi:hypothetical protein